MKQVKRLFKEVVSSEFAKNVFIMASGTAGAQIVGILLMPAVTRLYGPEAFGILGVFTALGTSLIPVAALTYPVAIVLAESDQEAKDICGMSLLISCILSVFITICFFFFGEKLSQLLNLSEIYTFIYLIPFLMMFAVFAQVARQWNIRYRKYKNIANASMIQALIINGAKLSAGLVFPTGFVLIIIFVVGQLLQGLLLLTRDSVAIIAQAFSLSWPRVKLLALKYYDFPVYRAPQVILNAFSESMPILFFTALYGPITAGYYSLARIALGIPAALIGQSVSDVFYPKFVIAGQKNLPKLPLILKSTFGLMVIGIIPYSIVFLIGPWLFTVVFGSEWLIAGEFSRWLSIWLFATLFTRPIVAAIPVLKLQQFFLWFEVCSLILRAAVLYGGYKFFAFTALVNVMCFSITNMLLFGILTLLVLLRVKRV